MDGINASLMREHPDQYKQGGFGIDVTPLRDALLGDSRPVIMVLAGAVGLVLLLACANVANLLLARGESRGRELAVRTALGASRLRIIRQLLTESVLLSLAGAAAGLAVAGWCQRAILSVAPAALPRLASVSLDRPVLLFAMALGVATGVLFGLIPAARVSRVPVTASLKDGGRGSTDAGRRRVRQTLVVAQVAIAVVLLVAGGLLLKSFTRLMAQPAGIDTSRVLTFRISLPAARYAGRPEVAGFFSRLLESRVRAARAFSRRGAATGLPLALASGDWSFDVEGRPRLNGRHSGAADWYVVTPGYFETLGVRVVSGRAPAASDDEGAAASVFLNETAARVFFANEDPIGRRLQMTRTTGAEQPWRTIAGVVSDVRQRGLDEAPRAELFMPYRQFQHFSAGMQARAMTVVVKTSGDPLSLGSAVREQLRALDPEVPAAQMRDMDTVLSQSVAPRRLNVLLIGAFAVLALALALIGLYGVNRLHGPAAHARDRRPDRDRRDPGVRAGARRRRRDAPDRDWRGARIDPRAGRRRSARRPAVPGRAARPADPRTRRPPAARLCRAGQLHARASRDAGRPRRRTARRLSSALVASAFRRTSAARCRCRS
jgi:putative ABC transport system permease protein